MKNKNPPTPPPAQTKRQAVFVKLHPETLRYIDTIAAQRAKPRGTVIDDLLQPMIAADAAVP